MYKLGAAAGSPLYCFHLPIRLYGFMLEVHVHERYLYIYIYIYIIRFMHNYYNTYFIR